MTFSCPGKVDCVGVSGYMLGTCQKGGADVSGYLFEGTHRVDWMFQGTHQVDCADVSGYMC